MCNPPAKLRIVLPCDLKGWAYRPALPGLQSLHCANLLPPVSISRSICCPRCPQSIFSC